MRIRAEYDAQADCLQILKGKACPTLTVKYRPGMRKVIDKVTFNWVGVELSGFRRNWGRAPPDHVCEVVGQALGIEPGAVLAAMTTMTPAPQ